MTPTGGRENGATRANRGYFNIEEMVARYGMRMALNDFVALPS